MSDPVRVAYQGESGAFSEQAARLFLGPAIETVACRRFAAVFSALASGQVDYAAVPYANSLAGPVPDVCRLLADAAVRTLDRIVLPIEQALIVPPDSALEDVRRVYSHPMALRQCTRVFRAHPDWQACEVEDTAGAVARVMEQGRADGAAIASRHAASIYGGKVVIDNVQDRTDNATSFYLIPRKSTHR